MSTALNQADEPWVLQLQTWRQNGTMDRLIAAHESKMPVLVERRDGRLQPCLIAEMGGGGVAVAVMWKDPYGEDRSKVVNTEKLLAWNPWLGPIEDRGEPQPVGLTDAEWRAHWEAERSKAHASRYPEPGGVWVWEGDGDGLESLASTTAVSITAGVLRDLLEDEHKRGYMAGKAAK